MCFHYALSKLSTQRSKRFSNSSQIEFTAHANGFSHPKMPVITSISAGKFEFFNWGLVPSWIKDNKSAIQIRKSTLNAKSETIFEKPSFSKAIKTQRCLIPSTGFFEWQDVNGKKVPYFISLKDSDDFCFAGIWDSWNDQNTGETLNTFSILTTIANPLMAEIHNTKKRMPVILTPETEKAWLNPSLSNIQINELTAPINENLMIAHKI